MMKKTTIGLAVLATTLLCTTSCDQSQKKKEKPKFESEQPSFSFELSVKPSAKKNAPDLQSFAHGVHGDYWVLFSGRTNRTEDDGGIHNMDSSSNYSTSSFPPVSFNESIHLYNFKEDKLSSVSLVEFQEYLNLSIGEKPSDDKKEYVNIVSNAIFNLRCTNPLVTQVEDYLYVIGGYGTNIDSTDSSSSYQTFNTVTQLHLPTLVNLLTEKKVSDITSLYRQGSNDKLKSTGGEVHYIDGTFYLCGGHNYGKGARNGQQYVDAVYPFTVSDAPNNYFGLDIEVSDPISDYPDKLGTAYADSLSKFRRRDGPMVPIIYEKNEKQYQGVAFYGGVFMPGEDPLKAWNNAIYVTSDQLSSNNNLDTYKIDNNYNQKNYNVYSCPDFGVVTTNKSGETELHTFLPGGIGDGKSDGNLSAFSNSYVEAILNTKSLTSTAEINEVNLFNSDKFYGAEAAFIKNSAADVIYFTSENGETEFIDAKATFGTDGGSKVIGYFYGGIEAQIESPAANNKHGYGPGLSKATNKIWEVTLTASPIK